MLHPATIMSQFRDGDERGWDAEFEYLRTNHGPRLRELARDILHFGVTTPILLGNDGRVWDGHHRLYIAHAFDFQVVPVTFAGFDNRY